MGIVSVSMRYLWGIDIGLFILDSLSKYKIG